MRVSKHLRSKQEKHSAASLKKFTGKYYTTQEYHLHPANNAFWQAAQGIRIEYTSYEHGTGSQEPQYSEPTSKDTAQQLQTTRKSSSKILKKKTTTGTQRAYTRAEAHHGRHRRSGSGRIAVSPARRRITFTSSARGCCRVVVVVGPRRRGWGSAHVRRLSPCNGSPAALLVGSAFRGGRPVRYDGQFCGVRSRAVGNLAGLIWWQQVNAWLWNLSPGDWSTLISDQGSWIWGRCSNCRRCIKFNGYICLHWIEF